MIERLSEMKNKNYPLYETTEFADFRIMTENVADKYPDRVAFSFREDPRDEAVSEVTFDEVRRDVRNIGTALINMGMRDKNIAIIGEASYKWISAFFAVMSIGAVSVPIDKELPAEDIAGIVNKAECAAVIFGSSCEEKLASVKAALGAVQHYISFKDSSFDGAVTLADIAETGKALYEGGDNSYYDYEIDPDKLVSIVFTSGTTGKGKGVMLSTRNIASDMTQGMYNFLVTDKTMLVLPPHHTFCSTINLIGHFSQGSTVYISSGLRYIMKELKEQQPKHLLLVPLFVETFYKRIWSSAEKSGKADALRKLMKVSNGMRKTGIDLRRKLFKEVLDNFGGKLEFIICGGAALNQDIIDTFDSLGITILNGYGITECSPLISCNRNKWQKSGSVGTPIIGEQVKIINPDENGEGEIAIKGPNVMLGYYKDPEATAAAFDEEGYFKTGDYGKLDEDGWIYITGRLKNLIIFSNGKNVYPEEIETEISRIPGVNEVVVYAGESKSTPGKEVIVAEIYPDFDSLSAKGIEDCKKYFTDEVKKVNARMVSYKAVGLVKIRKEEFIKNTSKKIIRYKIDRTID